jgi:uncharacterized membrane protein YoaK (UPF0700 family)
MTGNIVASTVALVGLATRRSRRTTDAADRAAWRALLLGFVAGCVLGAFASQVVTRWAWPAPALISGLLAAGVSRTGLPAPLRRDE